MNIVELTGLVGSIASISGYSLRDITKIAKNKKDALLLLQTATRYLTAQEIKDDGLVGLWTLEQASYVYERHCNWYVTGNLAVLYATERGERWHCQLFLEYRKFHSGLPYFPANGYLAHVFGACVTGIYEVIVVRGKDGNLIGQSSMMHAYPSQHVKDQAIIEQIYVDGQSLIAEVKNTNTQGQGVYRFFMRKGWKDVASSLVALA